MGVTPVHIPNTMVKTQSADDTLLETARESRRLPAFRKKCRKALYRHCVSSDLRAKYVLFSNGCLRNSLTCTLKIAYSKIFCERKSS